MSLISSKLCVPEYKHQAVIEKIFAEVDRDIDRLLPLLTLVVFVEYATVRLLRLPSSPPPPPSPINSLEFEVSADVLLEHQYLLSLSSSSSNNINNHEDEEMGLEKERPDSLEAKKQQSCLLYLYPRL
ncbi:hypothetical protein M0R45_038258 [Rubus argutus]|uniref:Uncharacterized protein n=1 Tax=Rubus argutus TaxID=59490 RepID=A0AAW1W514_RUBAR